MTIDVAWGTEEHTKRWFRDGVFLKCMCLVHMRLLQIVMPGVIVNIHSGLVCNLCVCICMSVAFQGCFREPSSGNFILVLNWQYLTVLVFESLFIVYGVIYSSQCHCGMFQTSPNTNLPVWFLECEIGNTTVHLTMKPPSNIFELNLPSQHNGK